MYLLTVWTVPPTLTTFICSFLSLLLLPFRNCLSMHLGVPALCPLLTQSEFPILTHVA